MADYGVTDRCTGGTASADSEAGAQYDHLAFDDNASTYWQGLEWIKYDFGVGISWAISKITIQNFDASNGFNGFTVHGSNNDSDYDTINTDSCAASGNVQTFLFGTDNTTKYRYVYIQQTSIYGALAVMEIEMFELLVSPKLGVGVGSPMMI